MSDGIAAGIMQIVRPLIDFRWTGLDHFFPAAVGQTQHGDSIWHQHAQDLLAIDGFGLPGDEQVDHIVNVRQLFTAERNHGDIAIDAERPNLLTRGVWSSGIGGQAVDLKRRALPQAGEEFPGFTAEHDDETTLHTGVCEERRGFLCEQ